MASHSVHFRWRNQPQPKLISATFHFFGGLYYPTFADFLLGNPIVSIDVPGVFGREWRVWDGNLYAQDDYRITPKLTLNLGLRYERQGQLGDNLGRGCKRFDPRLANPNPPATGSF